MRGLLEETIRYPLLNVQIQAAVTKETETTGKHNLRYDWLRGLEYIELLQPLNAFGNWNEGTPKGCIWVELQQISLLCLSGLSGCKSLMHSGEVLPSPFPPPQPVPALAPNYRSHNAPAEPTESPELCTSLGTLRIASGTINFHRMRLAASWSMQHGGNHPPGRRRRNRRTQVS